MLSCAFMAALISRVVGYQALGAAPMTKPPPAASRQAPDTKEAASESSHRIGAAISSALAIRFMATAAARRV